jgi:hypothetical protein
VRLGTVVPILFPVVLIAAAPAHAEQAQPVSGRVLDATGKPVRGATISVQGGATATVKTGGDGTFTIDADIGDSLVIDADGFQSGLAAVVGPQIGDVVLLALDLEGEVIEVTGEAPAIVPGAAKLDREELQKIPGTGGDFVRSLTAMPGVVNLQVPLGYNGVVIRGSSPQDSKVLIDGFEVPVLFHNIGFRAVLPAEAIDSLDYIPGGFDVAFGRASSGIVSLRTRAGAEKRTTQAELSFIDGGLVGQGPIGDKTRYMVALRRSTIDFFLPALIPDDVDLSLTTVPSYWDEQFRIDHQLSSQWKLSLSSLGTDDIFELYATKQEDEEDKRFFNRTRFLRVTAAARWSNGPWSADLALSGLLQQFVFEAGANQFIDVRQPNLTPRTEVTRTFMRLGPLRNVEWRIGSEAVFGRSSADLALPLEVREGEPMPNYDPDDVAVRFQGKIWLPNHADWTALTANVHPRVRATAGLRLDYFGRPDQLVVEPRGEVKVALTGPWSARASLGEFARPPEFQSEILEDHLTAERSTQLIAGLQYDRGPLRAQSSLYYYHRRDLITHNADNTLGNNGTGRTVGGELLGTYKQGPWFGWLSYSYSRSTRVDQPGEPRRLFSFDQPHSLNAAVSWRHGKWQLGGRFQLYSGLPFTPALGAVFDSDRNVYVPIFADPNSDRAPLHHQLDLRIDRDFRAGPVALTAFVDVQNVYLNESVVTYFYSYDYSERSAFKSLPLVPSLGLRGVL